MGERMDKAPPAPLDRVEWRVQGSPHSSRAQFVPYLDAPTVADLLDDWVGPDNWSDEYQAIDSVTMWCKLSIRTGDGEWVAKRDLGTAAATEPAKSLVSDAFKRVAMRKWGVGRNVYDLPILWAPCDVRTRNGKETAYPNAQTVPDLQRQLRELGFTEAGEKVRVGGAPSDDAAQEPDGQPAAAVPSFAQGDHERLLASLREAIDQAQRLHIEGDYDAMTVYDAESADNARKALHKLNAEIQSKVPF